MKSNINALYNCIKIISIVFVQFVTMSCNQQVKEKKAESTVVKPEYFLLHPKLETTYGFTQAVRIGDVVKISGVVSIDENGQVIGKNDFKEQMKNCYADIEKVLKHYGYTFEDVVVENYFTTNMNELHQNALYYRKQNYKNHYPTGSWIGVKELGSPDMMIEIEVEAFTSKK